MTAPVRLLQAAAGKVTTGGTPVVVFYGGMQGGFITNPLTAGDQGIGSAETLFYDLVNPATAFESETTFPLPPGSTVSVPAGQSNNVTVNAATSGHKFSAILIQPGQQPTPTPTPQPFPPASPTALATVVPSYLYVQYADDSDLQAFVGAYNSLAQSYIAWFNTNVLGNYTALTGTLLDWLGQGIYGIARPSLGSGLQHSIGPINTWVINTLPYNKRKIIGPTNVTAVTDDIYKRIITWHFFKGDGKVFTIRWLKRRVMRFLTGVNGVDPGINQTYAISVTFGANFQVTITLLQGQRFILGGAIIGQAPINGAAYNTLRTVFVSNPNPLPNGPVFQEAVGSMVLELPFQFSWKVNL